MLGVEVRSSSAVVVNLIFHSGEKSFPFLIISISYPLGRSVSPAKRDKRKSKDPKQYIRAHDVREFSYMCSHFTGSMQAG